MTGSLYIPLRASALAALLLATQAAAQDMVPEMEQLAVPAAEAVFVAPQDHQAVADDQARFAMPALASGPARTVPFAAEPLDDGDLRSIAGREDVNQISRADQTAGVSRNSVGDNAVTGDARIDGNAFQNMSGLSILSVNTGNNVAMNAAMNVNVSIQQGP